MKLEVIAAGIVAVMLGISTASADFVYPGFDVFDDFSSDTYEGDARRTESGVDYNAGRLVASGDAGFGADVLYDQFSAPLDSVFRLRLTDITNINPRDTETGGAVTIYADLADSNGVEIGSESAEVSPDSSADYVEFDFAGVDNVAEIYFFFGSDQPFELTSESFQISFQAAQAVPEPASIVLFGLASAGGGVVAWRKRRKRSAV